MTNLHPGDIRLDPEDRRPAPPRSRGVAPVLLGVVLGLAAIAAWVWWSNQPSTEVAAVPEPTPVDAPPPAPGPVEAAIEHPVDTPEGTPPLQADQVTSALARLLGSGVSHLQTDDFPRRFAATADSLARSHAPVLMWPVQPTPGRFMVEERPDGSKVIADANAQRYASFVGFASSVDSAAAVQLYTRMYPLLQEAYRKLGFGERYLNDRVVKVIDHLLATPEPSGPLQVRLTEVKGPVTSTQPWVRYEYADAELEDLSSGQKMLLRMGPANERKLKQKLKEVRAHLVRPGAAAVTR